MPYVTPRSAHCRTQLMIRSNSYEAHVDHWLRVAKLSSLPGTQHTHNTHELHAAFTAGNTVPDTAPSKPHVIRMLLRYMQTVAQEIDISPLWTKPSDISISFLHQNIKQHQKPNLPSPSFYGLTLTTPVPLLSTLAVYPRPTNPYHPTHLPPRSPYFAGGSQADPGPNGPNLPCPPPPLTPPLLYLPCRSLLHLYTVHDMSSRTAKSSNMPPFAREQMATAK